jgi:hypothetical protein
MEATSTYNFGLREDFHKTGVQEARSAQEMLILISICQFIKGFLV